LIKKAVAIGLKDEQETEVEKYALYFTNSLALLTVIVAGIYFILYVLMAYKISIIHLTFTVLGLISFALSYYGFRKTASLYILSLLFFIIIFTSLVGGFDIGIHPLLIVITLCSASIFLSLKLAITFNIILFVLYVIASNYSNQVGPWLKTPVLPNREYVNFGFIILMTFVIARLILNNVLTYINNLQKTLNEANAYITQINEQNKKLEMFNTIAAHDLRTPTRQIISFSGLAKRWDKQIGDLDQLDGYLNQISKAGYRMNELIESISIFESIDRYADETISPIKIASIVAQVEQSNSKYDLSNVVIENLATHKINFRYNHLFFIFQNIIANAIKFNVNPKKLVRIMSNSDEKNLHINIEDNGIGIANEFKDKLFKPFYKLHNHEAYSGAGLGLYFTQKIILGYDGTISYAINEKGGTTFTISLPRELIV